MARIVASSNQGKSSKGRKSSRPSSRIQRPNGETFVTSASEVPFPRFLDLMFVLLDQPEGPGDEMIAQSMTPR